MNDIQKTLLSFMFCSLVLLVWGVTAVNAKNLNNRTANYAFYYGSHPPIEELKAFGHVIVDPDSNFQPGKISTPNTEWLAYVSIGEVHATRDYAKSIPEKWLVGKNAAWESKLIDQSADGWPEFFVKNVITPLWKRGYRGFFLDTMDSYQLFSKTPEEREKQQAGIVALIKAIKKTYPKADLVFNRGFEFLPQVSKLVSAVALESLYRGWNQSTKQYIEVPEQDRQWLVGQIETIQKNYQLPVISIDYCAPDDKQCADEAIKKIRELNVIPYVTDGAISRVGRSN